MNDDRDDPAFSKIIFEDCRNYRSMQPIPHITQEQMEEIALDYTLLPTFEYKLMNLRELQEHSFTNNKRIQCKWHKYISELDRKKNKNLMQFPHVDEDHFFNYYCRYMPSLTPANRTDKDNRYKLIPGPGVDYKGQLPIPIESFTLRGFCSDKSGKKVIEEPVKVSKIKKR